MADEPIGDPTGAEAPIGAVPAGGDPTAPAEPQVYEVDDNTLIKPKGLDKPVKYGEHVRGLQSEFTRAKQQAAQVQRELERERQLRQQYEQERQAAAQRQNQPQGDPYEKIRQQPYISGEHMVGLLQGVGQQFQMRDKIVLAALQELKSLKEMVTGMYTTNSETEFDGWMKGFLQDNGYPLDALDTAKEIYLAYEGDNLREDFPGIFKQRWEQLTKAWEAQRQQALQRNRGTAFVPGKGGKAGPSKPLQLKGNEDPRQIADMFWENLHSTGT